MSRVGRKPIPVPSGVRVNVQGDSFVAEGPKGRIEQRLLPGFPVAVEDGKVTVSRSGESGPERAKHGLLRSLLANAVQGVSAGFTRGLEINGVGYKAELKGEDIHFALGYSHPVVYRVPAGIKVEVEKNTKLTVSGADRQMVGQVAAEIRRLKPPDPYKAKGIKYVDEVLRRKVGKAGAK
ncbi:MAG: 50S ribosomal protein L6 [Holophagales bacterium]|nr:MAG: 50S ribosomal protein L6 [Holophagales bacterium]